MTVPTSTRTLEHRALPGAWRWRSRIRAVGAAAAPRTDAPVLSRGTHRTRVSEMRPTAARATAPRPDVLGAAGGLARRAAAVRGGRGRVRSGTG